MTENRYANGKIYKIVSEKSDKIYIGSTCKKYLSERLAGHKNDYKLWKAGTRNKVSSSGLIELGDVSIVLLELFPCNTKDELLSRERHYIELYKNDKINKYIPTRTDKERYEDNKDKKLEYQNQYYEDNKQSVIKKSKRYYEDNKQTVLDKAKIKIKCECGSEITRFTKVRHERSKKHIAFTEIKL